MQSPIPFLSGLLERKGYQFLIIGGLALQASGYARATLDVDCLIAADDLPKFHDAFLKAGYQQEAANAIVARYIHESLLFPAVDVLLVNSATFQKMWSDSQGYLLDEYSVRVPCLEHLIALKLHAMKCDPDRVAKDHLDIETLLRVNKGAIGNDQFLAICTRFGPADIAKTFASSLF